MKAVKTISPVYALLLAVIALSAVFSGCATVFKGTRQEISVTSNPPGASVFVNNVSFGQTPTVIDLQRNKSYTVLLELHGFKPYELKFERKWNTLFYINIPVVGWVVDALSGAMYKLTPQEVNVMLQGQAPANPANPTMPMYVPDSTKTEHPDGATITPQKTVPETTPADSTGGGDDDNDADTTGESGGTLEAHLQDGRLYLFVVMEADPHWEKVGQLERVTD